MREPQALGHTEYTDTTPCMVSIHSMTCYMHRTSPELHLRDGVDMVWPQQGGHQRGGATVVDQHVAQAVVMRMPCIFSRDSRDADEKKEEHRCGHRPQYRI